MTIPLLADKSMAISRAYGVLKEGSSGSYGVLNEGLRWALLLWSEGTSRQKLTGVFLKSLLFDLSLAL